MYITSTRSLTIWSSMTPPAVWTSLKLSTVLLPHSEKQQDSDSVEEMRVHRFAFWTQYGITSTRPIFNLSFVPSKMWEEHSLFYKDLQASSSSMLTACNSDFLATVCDDSLSSTFVLAVPKEPLHSVVTRVELSFEAVSRLITRLCHVSLTSFGMWVAR